MNDQEPQPRRLNGADPGELANLDLGRAGRRGYPEAVYCQGKTPEQVSAIAARLRAAGEQAAGEQAAGERMPSGNPAPSGNTAPSLFTRADPAHAEAVLAQLPDAAHYPDAALLAWPPHPPEPTGGTVLTVTAGTSDLRPAREAQLTATYLGRRSDLVADVGVAGLHRVLARLEELRAANAIIVAAGMDGALASVVAGLVEAPVVALPTSVGYGAAFGGIAPLLTMLNACAPGVGVVNIDNGYGAGHLAAQITRYGPR
ncbi:MAG TPA: nickel pincer cofactor biosynthesis protein LarB [Ruania sp.]|nr:nickel pincer cofactor biosynthesis protein LarB [Ruania sp.]